MATVDCAPQIVGWAEWGVAHKAWFDYAEIRPFPLYQPSASRIITDDCSATVCLWFYLGGAPNPMDAAYTPADNYGNSDTLAALGTPIASALSTIPADVVVYWPMGDDACEGASQHTALIVKGGIPDPLTVSHGQPSEPAFVTVSQDGRPHRFYRFNTTKPAPPAPPAPLEDEMQFLAEGPASTATFLYDVQSKTRKGLSKATTITALEAVGIKNYGATLNKAFLALFVAEANFD